MCGYIVIANFSDKQKIHFPEMYEIIPIFTEQNMKFSIEDLFSKCHQIHRKLRISSHLLKKSLMENFIFCGKLIGVFQIQRFNQNVQINTKSHISYAVYYL